MHRAVEFVREKVCLVRGLSFRSESADHLLSAMVLSWVERRSTRYGGIRTVVLRASRFLSMPAPRNKWRP